jgi:hypothetical protein
MGVNYYSSNDKTMAQTTNRLISYDPAQAQQQRFTAKDKLLLLI